MAVSDFAGAGSPHDVPLDPTDCVVSHVKVPVGVGQLTVPRCDLPFSDQATSAWYYVSDSEWDLGVPAPSWMACSTGVLHGRSARYITRWDEDYWEGAASHQAVCRQFGEVGLRFERGGDCAGAFRVGARFGVAAE